MAPCDGNKCNGVPEARPECIGEPIMGLLGWAFLVLIMAGVAASFGFGVVATAAAGTAKLLFFISLVIFIVLIVVGMLGATTAAA